MDRTDIRTLWLQANSSVIILITLSFRVGTRREAYCDSLVPSVGRSGTEGGILTLSLGLTRSKGIVLCAFIA